MTLDTSASNDTDGLVAYFGYGSLVNRATLRTAIVDAVPARLHGWRRSWRPRHDGPGFPAALLTIVPDADAVCDGLLVFDRAANLPAVDEREIGYRRAPVAFDRLETIPARAPDCPVHVYIVDEDLPAHPEPPRILRSYLEAVMQGFLTEHGEAGLKRFLAETAQFETAVHDDRAEPLYPRSVDLSESERALFDDLLSARGVPARG